MSNNLVIYHITFEFIILTVYCVLQVKLQFGRTVNKFFKKKIVCGNADISIQDRIQKQFSGEPSTTAPSAGVNEMKTPERQGTNRMDDT